MIEETLGEPIAAQLLQARATSDQQSELIRAQAELIRAQWIAINKLRADIEAGTRDMATLIAESAAVVAQWDALLKAWSGFPGRSCAEAEWNAWVLRMNRAVIETPPQGKA